MAQSSSTGREQSGEAVVPNRYSPEAEQRAGCGPTTAHAGLAALPGYPAVTQHDSTASALPGGEVALRSSKSHQAPAKLGTPAVFASPKPFIQRCANSLRQNAAICLGTSGLPYGLQSSSKKHGRQQQTPPSSGQDKRETGIWRGFLPKSLPGLKSRTEEQFNSQLQNEKISLGFPQSQGELDFRTERWLPALHGDAPV